MSINSFIGGQPELGQQALQTEVFVWLVGLNWEQLSAYLSNLLPETYSHGFTALIYSFFELF